MTGALFEIVHTAWSIFLVMALGLGPGTLVVRRLALPAFFWLPITCAASSVIAYALFWLYLFHPVPARTIAMLACAASIIMFGATLMRTPREVLRQRDAWLPVVLMVLVLMMYLGCLRWAAGISVWQRFTVTATAVDHLLPRLFADRIYNGLYRGPHPPPLTTDAFGARSSDRPPLQAAMLVAVRPLQLAQDEWASQVIATTCQAVWVPALYALGRALRLRRRQLAFALVAAVCSGFFLFHTLYTWPKLYAAWLFLAALALMIHQERAQEPGPPRWTIATSLTVGALLALSLLAHGGIVFSFLTLPFVVVCWKLWRHVTVGSLIGAAAAALLLLAPWMAYQRLYDPPGDRLIKLHLAGVETEDARGTLTAIADAYRAIGWSEYAAGRWSNVQEQGIVLGKSGRSRAIDWIQWQQFFHHVPALDFVLFGFLGLFVWRRADATGRDLRALSGYACASLLVWIVLMFPPNSALIHHGSYATAALLFFCGGALLAGLPGIAGTALLVAHVGLFAIVWIGSRTLEGTTPRYWCVPAAALMGLAFLGFFAILRQVPDE